jgi:DNA-binding PadR family transcriptional regulator
MRWLQSGLRRDICIVVAGLDAPTGQQAKAALERRYDDRIKPETFHGALEALVSAGFLTRTQDGLADRYALTDAGERGLRAQYDWLASTLAALDEAERDTGDVSSADDDGEADGASDGGDAGDTGGGGR